ncbi:UbiD family decarboxylase [Rubinisphaera italica]|uniref:4-hydroxybenzoate decarboxylase subunit C n=1 Tax=Rubinisphaera italica TaxID=2527969 RepID=A0A5C5XMH6_9PLAN|nr:UbiD family decarboxylase [Rubinisphaera italica]TWT63305.1 4-hydroxybenzoate decarboxylase subunit C [Rubinisphaera italica]
MANRSLAACLNDLKRGQHLLEIDVPIDPHLQMAEIQRRVYQAQGPALLFKNVTGCRFPMVGNLFGTMDRTRYLFRHTLENVRQLVALKIDPNAGFKAPLKSLKALPTAIRMLPRKVRRGPILKHQIQIEDLPQLVSWPKDGGAFVTLPQVYSEDVAKPGLMGSNLGMYRVQLSGNEYEPNRQIGLHYQIHRSIGVHHSHALAEGKPFRVNIFVGGHPAMTLAAVMPLPEGMSELMFGGALAGHRIPMITSPNRAGIYAEADFCIVGTIDPERQLPEGPFGDHLGYYSLQHEFPVLNVEAVYHRPGAIWPFTVVGRPPQEDTAFGEIIHEITGPIIPTVIAGVHEIHAVDAAGVHPLLLAIGSERYVPYAKERRPQELLTCANAILGQGQLSLAKYLIIAAHEDDPSLNCHDISKFLQHVLQRADWTRDLHFQTRTTIDTLDYSGSGFNEGSKLVIAAAGAPKFELQAELTGALNLPHEILSAQLVMPGVLAVSGLDYQSDQESRGIQPLLDLPVTHPVNKFRLVIVVDDAEFAAATLNNFLWTTFTRSNPAADIFGIGAFTDQKHWGCEGALIIDARVKPHHAPPLIEDPEVTRSVDALAAKRGPLHGIIS